MEHAENWMHKEAILGSEREARFIERRKDERKKSGTQFSTDNACEACVETSTRKI